MLKRYSLRRELWVLIVCGTCLCVPFHRGRAAESPSPVKQPEAETKVAPVPEFSVSGGIFQKAFSLRLSSKSGTIRYTLDGSDPTGRSRKYGSPLTVFESTVVRARAFEPGSAPSPIVGQAYTMVDAEVAKFTSNLPIVFINPLGQTIEHDTKKPAYIAIIGPKGDRSSISIKPEYDGRATISIRGNTSMRYPKRSYHFKTRNENGEPLKLPMLGFPKESDWILYAPYPDKTLMRDVLAYELSNKMGDYAPRTRFVEVFVASSRTLTMQDYAGVYVFEEKIKRDHHRVDVTKLNPDDVKEPEIYGGYIFKKDHLERNGGMFMPNDAGMPDMRRGSSSLRAGFPTDAGGFPARPEGFLKSFGSSFSVPGDGFSPRRSNRQPPPPQVQGAPDSVIPDAGILSGFNDETIPSSLGFGTPKGNQFFYVEPKPAEITTKQKAWLKRYLGKLERALYGQDFRNPTNGYAAFIDVDSFIDHHLLVESTKNVDGFRFSTFYYKDRGGKVHMGPIWDWNLSFGNVNGKQGWIPRYWYWPQLDDHQYSWFRRLFQDPDFGQKYVDRWAALRTNAFATSNVLSRVDHFASVLREPQARNFQRWRIIGRPVWPNHFVGSSYEEEVDWLKEYIETRFRWIDDQFVTAPGFSLKPGTVPFGSKLGLTGPPNKPLRIYFTEDGTDPRASGGAPSLSAKIYEGPIPLKESSRIFARAVEGNLWSAPAIGEFRASRK